MVGGLSTGKLQISPDPCIPYFHGRTNQIQRLPTDTYDNFRLLYFLADMMMQSGGSRPL